jgi:hypothetical protein
MGKARNRSWTHLQDCALNQKRNTRATQKEVAYRPGRPSSPFGLFGARSL